MRQRKKEQPAYQSLPPCDVAGCPHAGEYKAPRQRGGGRQQQFYLFCLEHVREFNRNYNFFEGMKDDEVQKFMKEAVTGHRPTWKLGQMPHMAQLELEESLKRFFYHSPTPKGNAFMPSHIQDALVLFDLEHPATPDMIKRHYKILVKKYHPDVNKSEGAVEKFRQITESYHALIEHYKNF